MNNQDTYPNDAAFEYGFQHGQDLIKPSHELVQQLGLIGEKTYCIKNTALSLNRVYERHNMEFK